MLASVFEKTISARCKSKQGKQEDLAAHSIGNGKKELTKIYFYNLYIKVNL